MHSTCYRVIWKVCVFFPITAFSKTTNQLSWTVKRHASLNWELWVKETVHVLLFHSPPVVRSCRFQQDRSQLEIITTTTGIWRQNMPENQYQWTYITKHHLSALLNLMWSSFQVLTFQTHFFAFVPRKSFIKQEKRQTDQSSTHVISWGLVSEKYACAWLWAWAFFPALFALSVN